MVVSYWLCVTDEVNWRVVKNRRVWGVSDRYSAVMERVDVGDLLVFYVKPKRICGVFVAASKPYTSTERVFKSAGPSGREVYPHRVRLKSLVVPEECVSFESLIQKLKFIKNKKRWTGHIRGAMIPIPKEDLKLS